MNTPLKVAVRMYNVGFGDSFLVSVQQGGRPWRMLVDCGVHNQGGSGHDLDAVVDDIAGIASNGDGQPRLDIVVATHRHRDHILGFENPRWQNVEVGEVWLPWIEDPSDAQAVMLRARHDAAALALRSRPRATRIPPA